MSNNISKGRLIQIAQSYTNGGDIRTLESGEFGLGLDEGQERLWIGSNTGNIKVMTENDISSLTIPDGSISKVKLDGDLQTTIDEKVALSDIPLASPTTDGLISKTDKSKLSTIETGANMTVVENSLTSLSTTKVLAAYQGRLLNESKLNVSGGTMQGKLIAQSNTDYTSRQVRNITYSITSPTTSDGQDGDMWVVYE